MKKKKIFGIDRKRFVEMEINLIIVLAVVIIIILFIQLWQRPLVGKGYMIGTEHITAMVTVPDFIYANQEFITNIDLDVSGISNGILVTAYIPEGLEVNSITPNNGMFVEDTVIWILEPEDSLLSFSAVGNVGEYDLRVKFGTFDNVNEISEENSTMIMFNITATVCGNNECRGNETCDNCPDDCGICNPCDPDPCPPGYNCVPYPAGSSNPFNCEP